MIKHRLKAIQIPFKSKLMKREKMTENAHFVFAIMKSSKLLWNSRFAFIFEVILGLEEEV